MFGDKSHSENRSLGLTVTVAASRFIYMKNETTKGGEMRDFTFYLTDDVYDICDHGCNAAVHQCEDCEADAAEGYKAWRLEVFGPHVTDAKLV